MSGFWEYRQGAGTGARPKASLLCCGPGGGYSPGMHARIMSSLFLLGMLVSCTTPDPKLNHSHGRLEMRAVLEAADPAAAEPRNQVQITIWNRGTEDVLIDEHASAWKTILVDEKGVMHLPQNDGNPAKHQSAEVNVMRELRAGEAVHYRTTIEDSFMLGIRPGVYRVMVMRQMLNQLLQAETTERLVIP